MMLVIGLTGSIGMGKSTAAARFRALGIPVLDADAVVHALYAGAAVPLVEAAFPGSTTDGRIDRPKLAARLAAEPAGFARLESIVHPLVREAERHFLADESGRGTAMAVLEIPLLLETGGDALVDVVVVVSASEAAQRRRVLERPGMTPERLEQMLARQMPDAEKRRRADFVVDTNGDIAATEAQVDAIVTRLKGRRGQAYHRHWQRPLL
jgi:dephospho-CoA kinase